MGSTHRLVSLYFICMGYAELVYWFLFLKFLFGAHHVC